jgi:hypothetical protein
MYLAYFFLALHAAQTIEKSDTSSATDAVGFGL